MAISIRAAARRMSGWAGVARALGEDSLFKPVSLPSCSFPSTTGISEVSVDPAR
jgi:hypothetical protein